MRGWRATYKHASYGDGTVNPLPADLTTGYLMSDSSDVETAEQREHSYRLKRSESASEGVVRTVAAVSGRVPGRGEESIDGRSATALDPLYDTLDPDALDALFDPNARGASQSDLSVSFPYNDHTVTVGEGDTITVEPLAGER